MRRWQTMMAVVCGLGMGLVGGAAASATEIDTSTFTSSDTATPTANNYVYLPTASGSGSGKVLLFFPGSGSSLSGYTTFMEHAAGRGYIVIGLAYRNEFSPATVCGCMSSCMAFFEQQNVEGKDNGFFASDTANGITPAANSVNYRLHSLLDYLTSQSFGGVNWSQYWYPAGNHPYWSRIVVAGHSGGGNMATWMLKNENVISAIAFSAPSIINNAAQPPSSMLGDTPWAVGGTHGTCTPAHTVPSWVTSGWGSHLFVYDDERDQAYTAAWIGHDIPLVVHAIGGLSELPFSDGGTPSGRWITRTNNTTGCTGSNPHHGEPVTNCGLDHHGVWNYLLDHAATP